MRLEVSAATRYPAGKGELLRFHNGVRVGKADTSGLGSTALTAGLLLVGHVHYSRPAALSVTLPASVAEEAPPSQEPAVEILWKLGEFVDDVGSKLEGLLT